MARNRSIRNFTARLDRIAKTAPRNVVLQMEANSQELLQRARALSPRLTKAMENSGKITRTVQTRGRVVFKVEFGTTAETAKYFNFLHNATYALGPISRRKPGTSDGRVGPGFLSRPLARHSARWALLLNRAFKKAVADSKRGR